MSRPALSFDGKCIRGPYEFRGRIATFTGPDAARKWVTLLASAPDLLDALGEALILLDAHKHYIPKHLTQAHARAYIAARTGNGGGA